MKCPIISLAILHFSPWSIIKRIDICPTEEPPDFNPVPSDFSHSICSVSKQSSPQNSQLLGSLGRHNRIKFISKHPPFRAWAVDYPEQALMGKTVHRHNPLASISSTRSAGNAIRRNGSFLGIYLTLMLITHFH